MSAEIELTSEGASTAPTPAKKRGWLEVRERGTTLGIEFLVRLGTFFGRAPARLFLRLVVFYYVVFAPSVRRASRNYLRRVQEGVRFRDVFAHVCRFGEVVLDRVFIVSGRHHYFERESHGDEHLRALRDQGRGAILLGAHLGSFEAMALQAEADRLRVSALGYFRNAARINAALDRLRPSSPMRVIHIEHGKLDFILRIKEKIEAGEMVGILGDRVLGGDRAIEVPFLGGRARFPAGPFLLAAALRCPVLLTFGLYRAPRRYEMHCEPFADEIVLPRKDREAALRTYVTRYAERLEAYVRSAPDNWFNFYEFFVE